MRTLALAAVAWLTLTVGAAPARADDMATCLDAASAGQSMRDAHKLLEARDKFRICAQPTCPTVVRHDCVSWLNAVESAIPSVVPALKDGRGNDVLEARVTMDGHPFLDALTGAAVPIDPGPHAFRFERADGSAVEKQVLVGEGQQNLAVVASFAPAAAPPPAGGGVSPPPSPPPASTARTVGWVLGGVGVAGLVVGGIFGGLAVSDKGSGGCNASDRCTNFGAIGSAKTAADVADVGLIAGGALLAAGAGLILFAPRPTSPPSAWMTLTPTVGSNSGGWIVQGAW